MDSSCPVHKLNCLLKTGSTVGHPNYGKSYYMCPLYPKGCNYVAKASIPPRFCSRHKNKIIELQVFKDLLASGEKRHYLRCKEGKDDSGKYCEILVSKVQDETKSFQVKESKDDVAGKSSSQCCSNDDDKTKLVVKEQNKTVPFRENENNASFRNPSSVLSSSSSDDESDREEDSAPSALASDKKEECSLPSTGLGISEDWRKLQIELDRRKKVYNSSNVAILPDKGARLKVAIDQLELRINNLKLIEGKQKTAKEQCVIHKDGKSEEGTVYVDMIQKEHPVMVKESSESKLSLDVQERTKMTLPKYSDLGKTPKENILWNNYMMQFVGDAEMRTRIRNVMSELQNSRSFCPKNNCLEETPKSLLIPLLPHQRYALSWLLWRERHYPHGGILADDMGLGKTITMIALILKQKEYESQEQGATSKQLCPGLSLIVCPASIIHHWSNEIFNHCIDEAVRVYIYHGPNRIRSAQRLSEYDVVIVTYDTLCSEIKENKAKNKSASPRSKKVQEKSPILCIKWERIILDEAHRIKNYKTRTAQAICTLNAKYRWAVTGTPIHNNLFDLYSLMKFLHFFPFDELKLWKKYIEINTDTFGNLFKVLMNFILLRRLKDQTDEKGNCLINLPPKEMITIKLQLSVKERKVYDKFFKFCQSTVATFRYEQELKKNEGLMMSQSNIQTKDKVENAGIQVNKSFILVILLRLQQCCCHLSLLQKVAKYEIFWTEDEKEEKMFEQMEALSLNNVKKSMDSKDMPLHSLFCGISNDLPPDVSSTQKQTLDADFKPNAPSTKVLAILSELEKIRNRSEDGVMEKCVLISQWVSMLEIVAEHINKAGYRYSMIKGDVNVEARTKIVEEFNNDPQGAEILLLSLKAGGVGLNLIGGNHLFVLDIHWNPALENQACDRIYRLGQKKKVFIHKFVCENTIEEKIVSFQKNKMNLANNILSTNSKSQITLKDFYELLQI
ncbi:transcription termination factor 2-like isoform X2 [Centruroides sculpturatus]|uniref:transcription termination factor 2-like isoform X2 n=1 Tax=Centruroides sculpturatus TaxID=218467 RepID=UPI000C6D264A|nr:transcription termination factor 2-like isoform X2 [Centruroides sculpturatus]